MPQERSFTEYISTTRYDAMFDAVNKYIYANSDSLGLYSRVVRDISDISLSEIYIKLVTVDELPDNRLSFDIIIDAEIDVEGQGYRDWETDSCSKWFTLSCAGSLTSDLADFKILKTEPYNQKNYRENPLSDALVPYLRADKIDEAATTFLQKYYPEALATPMPVDTRVLTERMGLKVVSQQLTEDFSVFGQIFFADADSDVYDYKNRKMTTRHFEAGTIVVDPQTFLLRNIGSVNNTIVHECVHWDRHRKAFELERLYNASATQIKCIVVGGVKSESNRTANDWMEWQANVLAPQIQMPIVNFKKKASEYINKYLKLRQTNELVDVMEPVIDELASFFCVSRCAAKIRMVDVGYEEAIGAFTYIDGHYVKPHAFKKGSISKNQTYSISLEDAMFETLMHPALRDHSLKGDYVYVDSHVCVNNPKYVERIDDGGYAMTEYGRLHIDECCLAFSLTLKHANKYSEQFYKECVLYRDANSGLYFEAHFSPDSSKSALEKANAITELNDEISSLLANLPTTFTGSLEKIMEWRGITVEELAEESRLSSRTIHRLRTEADYNVKLKTVVAVCIAMHLHPALSRHLVSVAGLSFRYVVPEHAMYDFFISSYYTHSVDECNEILRAKNFKSLSGDE